MDFFSAHAIVEGSDVVANAREAVLEMRRAFTGFPAAILLFFAASERYDPETLAAGMQDAFPSARTFGCSSAGEVARGVLLKNAVSAIAFSPEVFENVAIEAVSGIDADALAVNKAFSRLERRLGARMDTLDHRRHFGLALVDGLANATERVTERIGELTDVLFTGGCAADDWRFAKTFVWHGGEVLENGVVLAIMRPRRRFAVVKTQSVSPAGPARIATRVDPVRRVVFELDGRPALDVYSETIGIAADRLTPAVFAENPLCLILDGEPFVRDIAAPEETGLRLFCSPIEGLGYHIARVRDLMPDTAAVLEARRREFGGIAAVVNVNCAHRDLIIRQNGQEKAFGALFSDFPCAGFASYGEIFVGLVNLTSTMIVFAAEG
ncbi:MAG: FIST C-terminal domain-containing protein [Planctomycetota bacterium]|jgi:hypothetical protein|nr:FIST C-terminal domain-containing protein [Planctomycetota bacterium]